MKYKLFFFCFESVWPKHEPVRRSVLTISHIEFRQNIHSAMSIDGRAVNFDKSHLQPRFLQVNPSTDPPFYFIALEGLLKSPYL
jgi:hypothetical protein